MNLAHGAAIDALRTSVPQASLGIIHQPCTAASDKPQDAAAAQRFEVYWNGAFPDPQLWLAKASGPAPARVGGGS